MNIDDKAHRSTLSHLVETESISAAVREALLLLVQQDAINRRVEDMDQTIKTHIEQIGPVRGIYERIETFGTELNALRQQVAELEQGNFVSRTAFDAELTALQQTIVDGQKAVTEIKNQQVENDKDRNDLVTGKPFTEPFTGMQFEWIPEQDGEAGFWAGKYQVTQQEWVAVMGSNPSHNKAGDRYPVESISYNHVIQFIQKLIARNLRNYNFDLPTESQWIHAAGAGGKKFHTGNELHAWHANFNNSNTKPVGSYQPNRHGLYDIHGNVWELCKMKNSEYIAKGGSYLGSKRTGSVFYRRRYTSIVEALGFRLIINPDKLDQSNRDGELPDWTQLL